MNKTIRALPGVLLTTTALLLGTGIWLIYLTRDVEVAQVYGARGAGAIVSIPFGAVGFLVARRRASNPIGWLFSASSLAMAFAVFAEGYATYSFTGGDLPVSDAIAWTQNWIWVVLIATGLIYPFLLFPDGHLPSKRWRWFGWFAATGITFFAVPMSLEPGQLQSLPVGYNNPLSASDAVVDGALSALGPVFLFTVVGAIAAMSIRFRRSRGDEREQMKWLLFAGSLLALSLFANVIEGVFSPSTTGITRPVAFATQIFAGLIAVAAGVAILKYHLYDIEVVISRTLTFGAMAIAITSVYVAIVVGLGSAIGAGDERNLAVSILGTAIIAVVFEPLRRRMHAFADRLVYGRRASVSDVLSELGLSAGAYAMDEALPRFARVVVGATAAERSAVWLTVGATLQRVATFPVSEGPVLSVPFSQDALPTLPQGDRMYEVRHSGELLGAISIGMRGNETPSAVDDRLVADVAGHAALVLRNARLIAELQASRQRLVAAQDTERRRIERDIHDGAQQQLVAMAMKLRLARDMAGSDTTGAQTLIDEIRADTTDALENLRALARGIYPPLLAKSGLVSALESQVARAAIPVTVHSDGIGRYPQETETTAYFCVLEALQNIAKYAGAASARVELAEQADGLIFSVSDDGVGFDPRTVTPGAGLSNMRDRIEALNGVLDITSQPGHGATVTGRVPIGAT